MGQILHGGATTTEAIRRAIQNSQESLRALSRRYGINQKTVAKWKRRVSTADLPTGPRQPKSTVFSLEEEAMIVAFRRQTLLPLDDCLYALQPTIAHLTRSSLHRCLQRHGISRLPQVEGDKPAHGRSSSTIRSATSTSTSPRCERRRASSTCIVAIDRTSKFAFVRLVERPPVETAVRIPEGLARRRALRIHTVLTDNGIQFCDLPPHADGPTASCVTHMFDMRCRNGIEHRMTQPNHPWTNGQVERMNRTIKEATVKRYHYDRHDQLERHLQDFIDAYNFARRLKSLNGLTPYEYICKSWTSEPEPFISIRSIKCRD